MKRISLVHSLLVMFLISLIGAVASHSEAAGPAIEARHNGDRVIWFVPGEYEGATLSIAIPGGTVVERRFGNHEEISFSPVDLVDASAVEGLYQWQLTLSPVLDSSARKALAAARAAGDTGGVETLRAEGVLPPLEDLVSSGSFRVANRSLVSDNVVETPSEVEATKGSGAPVDMDDPTRSQVIVTDLVVQGSECVGFDCVNGESFGFDTIRLKENNLRIHFQDTSVSASFPTNDWRIVANDTSNGGANYLAIEDSDTGRRVVQVDAGAPANSIRVDSNGDVGLGTSNPVLELHLADSDTPSVRLEQNGTGGWMPQTWDLAGNEANFFIRDVTHSSKLPFRIKPNAPTDSIYVDSTGEIGIGTSSPDAKLDVENSLDENFGIRLSRSAVQWVVQLNKSGDATSPNGLAFTKVGSGSREMQITEGGDLEILGNYFANGTQLNVPDYVFSSSYDLMSLETLAEFVSSEGHLPNVPAADEIRDTGLNMTEMQLRLLEKIEELTLYTIQQQETIRELEARLADLEKYEVE